jgi:iron-sulfur cluster assembly protein
MSEANCSTCPSTSPITEVATPSAEKVDATLTITPKAHTMLTQALGDSEAALLINVLDGGCSGYMYDLQLIEDSEETCQALEIDGISVMIPEKVSAMLDGIEIDYEDKLMGGGFKVNNPTADRTCGCGESFR